MNNLTEQADFQKNYQTLLRHYGLEGRSIQAGWPNENGDVEQRHYRLHRALDQALLLRGSRDFAAVDAYRAFLGKLFEQLNSGRKARLAEEMERLRHLPERRLDTAKRVRSRVNSGSLIVVERNSYSVNSRLIGEVVEARVFADHLEVWYGGQKMEQLPRPRGRTTIGSTIGTSSTGWCASPVRSPATVIVSTCSRAVASVGRTTCCGRPTPGQCDRRYLQILELAAKQGEAQVEDALRLPLANRPRPADDRRQGCVRAVPEALRAGP